MLNELEELEYLLGIAEEQKSEAAKIDGKIESLMEDLAKEGFSSEKEAEKEMNILEKKIERMKTTFSKKLAIFKRKYSDEL